jgi:cytochrome c oxidase assembly protein subunit 11
MANSQNRPMMKKLIVMALVMFGFAFALVPFYRKLCEVTGINQLDRADAVAEEVKNSQVDETRTINVVFDANSRGPWSFKPEQSAMQLHPGQIATVLYRITNNEPRAMVGQAIPSYAPVQAGAYFTKLECFCFRQQSLPGRQTREFPVVFVIDRKLPTDVHTITLSYTFFEVEGAQAAAETGSTTGAN